MKNTHLLISKILIASLFATWTVGTSAKTTNLADLELPPGFSIEVLNFKVPNARQIVLTEAGTLVVGTRNKGKVYAVPNALTDDKPEVIELFEGLLMPSGVALKDNDLYIGATNTILKVPKIDRNLTSNPPHQVITDSLPDERHHGWKYLKFGPDGLLYVPVGAPCNICLSDDSRFATILTMDSTTGETQIYAHGIRNTVGFDWHPTSNDLWFGDNGRDMMGDDIPPEEVNVATSAGQHFGYPYVHAGNIDDPEFGAQRPSQHLTNPTIKFQAHAAPLGLTFYTGQQFPKAYKNRLFLAEHGSWNRGKRVGYRISMVRDDPGKAGGYIHEPFISGWLINEKVSGRPNDVLMGANGELLISDDKQGVIYRVTYNQ